MSDELRAGRLSFILHHSSFITHHSSFMNWHAIDLVVCAEAEEAAHYGLFEAGAVGTETRPPDERTAEADDAESHCTHVNVSGYFEERPDDEEVRQHLGRAWH